MYSTDEAIVKTPLSSLATVNSIRPFAVAFLTHGVPSCAGVLKKIS